MGIPVVSTSYMTLVPFTSPAITSLYLSHELRLDLMIGRLKTR